MHLDGLQERGNDFLYGQQIDFGDIPREKRNAPDMGEP
jgi:hypothetical protein